MIHRGDGDSVRFNSDFNSIRFISIRSDSTLILNRFVSICFVWFLVFFCFLSFLVSVPIHFSRFSFRYFSFLILHHTVQGTYIDFDFDLSN